MSSSKIIKSHKDTAVRVDPIPFGSESKPIEQNRESNHFVAATEARGTSSIEQTPVRAESGSVAEQKPSLCKDSFEKGRAAAMKEGAEQLTLAASALSDLKKNLELAHQSGVSRIKAMLPDIALAIAKSIVQREIVTDKDIIISNVERALHEAIDSEEFRVELSPIDYETISKNQNDLISSIRSLKNIKIERNDNIEPGGCIVESSLCRVDATIESQLEAFRSTLEEFCDSAE